MKIARVISILAPTIDAKPQQRLLICQLLDSSGRIQLGPMVHLLALDRLGATPGSRVLLIDDPSAAARMLAGDIAPAEALVVSIIDEALDAPSRAA